MFAGGDFSRDFLGLSFFVPRGGILAYCSLPALSVPLPPTVTGGHSVFIVYELPDGKERMVVECGSNNITIGLPKEQYQMYVRFASSDIMQPVLNSMLVLPALAYALEQLRMDLDSLDDYADREWYQTIYKAYEARGRSLQELLQDDSSGGTSIEMAQELMDGPMKNAFQSLADLDSRGDA